MGQLILNRPEFYSRSQFLKPFLPGLFFRGLFFPIVRRVSHELVRVPNKLTMQVQKNNGALQAGMPTILITPTNLEVFSSLLLELISHFIVQLLC